MSSLFTKEKRGSKHVAQCKKMVQSRLTLGHGFGTHISRLNGFKEKKFGG
jgi:hypothetical protein